MSRKKPARLLSGSIERAREALRDKAARAAELVAIAAEVSAKRGHHGPAAWILEHTSEVVDGKEIRPIAAGIDRQQIEGGSRAPTINIGWINAPSATLAGSSPVVDVVPIEPLALPERTPDDGE